MTPAEHKARHITLHREFDELLADYLQHHPGALPTTIPLIDLMKWSFEQTRNPTELPRD